MHIRGYLSSQLIRARSADNAGLFYVSVIKSIIKSQVAGPRTPSMIISDMRALDKPGQVPAAARFSFEPDSEKLHFTNCKSAFDFDPPSPSRPVQHRSFNPKSLVQQSQDYYRELHQSLRNIQVHGVSSVRETMPQYEQNRRRNTVKQKTQWLASYIKPLLSYGRSLFNSAKYIISFIARTVGRIKNNGMDLLKSVQQQFADTQNHVQECLGSLRTRKSPVSETHNKVPFIATTFEDGRMMFHCHHTEISPRLDDSIIDQSSLSIFRA